MQYIGLGPAAVPVELTDQVLHLGQADVGGDHPVAAGQVLLSVGECTETPQYYEPVVLLYEQRSKNLQQQPVHSRKVQRQDVHRKKFSQHMFIVT